MEKTSDARKLAGFISSSPSVFHVVGNMAGYLDSLGYTELKESDAFSVEEGKNYYVRRNSSSLIAFRVPQKKFSSLHCIAAHTDNPTFKIKPNPEDRSSGKYTTLNVESYGGLVINSWFDRPLSIAGRAMVNTGEGLEERLVDFSRDLVSIPSLAIHLDRDINNGHRYSVQKECKPLFSSSLEEGKFNKLLSQELDVDEKDVLDYDLYLYSRTPASFWGAEGEFFSSSRLDDLMCAFSAFRAITEAKKSNRLVMIALFDNEEVGSSSYQGALSDFLSNTLERILLSLGYSDEERYRLYASSSLISADNGHAIHPNYSEKTDITNKPILNGGVIIKYSSGQKYATDSRMGAYVKKLMNEKGIPYQIFVNNSDIPGGGTLGNLSIRKIGIPTADVGLAQLAMHSSYETAGVEDATHILSFFKAYLED